jgi:hypothetical protein
MAGKLLSRVCMSDRYRTLNFQRSPTMEFRLFRGTLNPVSFWATLQLVDNLCRVAATVSDDNALLSLTWLDVINHHPYPELEEYNHIHVGKGWNGDMAFMHPVLDDTRQTMFEVQVPMTAKRGGKTVWMIQLEHGYSHVRMFIERFPEFGEWFREELLRDVVTDEKMLELLMMGCQRQQRTE